MSNGTQSELTVSDRLKRIGINLPAVRAPSANYIPARIFGNVVYIAGQVPRKDGADLFIGRVGEEISLEQAQAAARLCALNVIAQLNKALDGDLDRVECCLRLRGFINAAPGFGKHATVMDGASNLLVEVFGERGQHSRTAIGAGSLPHGFAVEVDGEFAIKI
jgi:enamine deaminase RidA (YjgF/YER057c/UK114 family)